MLCISPLVHSRQGDFDNEHAPRERLYSTPKVNGGRCASKVLFKPVIVGLNDCTVLWHRYLDDLCSKNDRWVAVHVDMLRLEKMVNSCALVRSSMRAWHRPPMRPCMQRSSSSPRIPSHEQESSVGNDMDEPQITGGISVAVKAEL